jgi:hypothetical protein
MEINFCPITGQLIEQPSRSKDGLCYRINFLGHDFSFKFCNDCLKKIPFDNIKHILRALLLNGKLKELQTETIHWDTVGHLGIDLKKLLEDTNYPRTPKDKLDNLVNELFGLQTYDGEVLLIGA